MPDTIKDGNSGNIAGVDIENRLKVYSTMESEISHESESNKRAYSWSHSYNSSANDTVLLIKNTSSSLNLIIDKIIISSDTTTQFVVHFPERTTLSGTTVTGVNLNRATNITADAVAYGDETGNSQGDIMAQGIVLNNTPAIVPVDGSIVLGVNNEIAVDFVTATTALGMVSIRGYYHEVL